MAENILILGGTFEAVELATRLVADGHAVTTSLAGRTRNPKQLPGNSRIGGFGGADGLARFVTEEKFTRLVDATHPFAERISANARQAANQTGVPFFALSRPGWQAEPPDRWEMVASLEAAVDAVPDGATAFLALGHQHIGAFAVRPDCEFIIRMVDAPTTPLPFQARIVTGRPSADPAAEARLFADHGVTCLVCRNSGGSGGHAKLVAARDLALPVIMIDRPLAPDRQSFTTVEALMAALEL